MHSTSRVCGLSKTVSLNLGVVSIQIEAGFAASKEGVQPMTMLVGGSVKSVTSFVLRYMDNADVMVHNTGYDLE